MDLTPECWPFGILIRFNVEENHWTQIPFIPGAAKPPPIAGHSATVHGQSMIIFGGLQKQRSSIGQFASSNDVWSFNIKSKTISKVNKIFCKPVQRFWWGTFLLVRNSYCSGERGARIPNIWILNILKVGSSRMADFWMVRPFKNWPIWNVLKHSKTEQIHSLLGYVNLCNINIGPNLT